MIAALVVAGLALLLAAAVGARALPAIGSPPARIALFGIGVALLFAAGTSAVLMRAQVAPAPVAPQQASQRIQRVMVIADDALVAGIPRSNAVFDRAVQAFEEELRRSGFAVVDGRAVPVVNDALEGARRPDAEIIQLARRQQPAPLDAIVLFSVVVPVEFTMNAQSPLIRGVARLVRVADASTVGVFEWTSPARWTLLYACDRACVLETVGTESGNVAGAVARLMFTALDGVGVAPAAP